MRYLEDWPDLPIQADNNLLAAPQQHFDRVIDRLVRHGWGDFNQGLDGRLLTDYHARRISEIEKPLVRLALDSSTNSARVKWLEAFDTLRAAGLPKSAIRSYALIGYDSGPAEAWERCQWITSQGIKVAPMWFHRLDALEYNSVTEDPLAGKSDSKWRERIGNAVPPEASRRIHDQIALALLQNHLGDTFTLGFTPIWVQPVHVNNTLAGRGPSSRR